jgi:pimeloyl-ACP methyl ester carboxylesterase
MKKSIDIFGKKIAYQLYGKGSNDMVIFHGLMGSSWLISEWIKAIEQKNLRCIVVEKPGYGDSTPIKMDCVADWFTFFQKIVDELNINNAVCVGISAGAVFAYASAFATPEAIDELWILNGVPPVYMDRVLRHYPKEMREGYNFFLKSTQEKVQDYYSTGLNDHIANLPEETDSYLRNSFIDAAANRSFGPAQQSRLQIRPWGFNPSEIKQRVKIWHAELDSMVPYDSAKEVQDILQFAELQTADSKLFKSSDTGLEIHMKSHSEGFLKILSEWEGNH